jgi:hypothetical protein
MKIEHARMAALVVAGLWMPNPPTIRWMVGGGEPSEYVLKEIERALFAAFGHADQSSKVPVDDPNAAKKLAVLAAAEAARFWGGYNPSMAMSHASLAYGITKSPYVQEDDWVPNLHRQEFVKQFIASTCGSRG